MTFPGESLAATGSGNVVGTPIAPGTLTYRAESSTFTAGAEGWLDVPLSPLLLEPGEPDVAVSWVIEVLGGSGTLALSEGAGSLGSHAVSAGTLVVLSSLTAADVTAGGTARLTIACTTGTVEVQQVKLRVWPVGGALGGLSDPYQPDDLYIALDVRRPLGTVYEITSYFTGTNRRNVMDTTQADLRGGFAGTPLGDVIYVSTTAPLGGGYYALVQETYGALPPVRGSGNIGGGVCYLERRAAYVPDPTGTYGVDWVYPPNEVPYDPDGWTVVGTDSWGWAQGVATIVNTPDGAGPASGTFLVGGDNVADVDPPTATFGEVTDAAPTIGTMSADDPDNAAEFDLPALGADGELTRLTFYHEGAKRLVDLARSTSDTQGATDTTGNASASVRLGKYIDGVFYPVTAAYTPAAYRYWTLTAQVRQPHQIFQRHDELGAGGALVFQPGTRQSTGSVFAAPF